MDEVALVGAVTTGRLRGAGLDVFAEEPLPEGHPLWEWPNVVIPPHVPAVTRHFWRRRADPILVNFRTYLAGGALLARGARAARARGGVRGGAAWGESMADIRAFKKGRNIDYPLLLGNSETVDAYKAGSLPTLYIIDQKGMIAASHQGFWTRDEIAEVVTGLLKKQ